MLLPRPQDAPLSPDGRLFTEAILKPLPEGAMQTDVPLTGGQRLRIFSDGKEYWFRLWLNLRKGPFMATPIIWLDPADAAYLRNESWTQGAWFEKEWQFPDRWLAIERSPDMLLFIHWFGRAEGCFLASVSEAFDDLDREFRTQRVQRDWKSEI